MPEVEIKKIKISVSYKDKDEHSHSIKFPVMESAKPMGEIEKILKDAEEQITGRQRML